MYKVGSLGVEVSVALVHLVGNNVQAVLLAGIVVVFRIF